MQCENSTVGKSIVIKGEIVASDPLYVYGCVEGSIRAPEQRVTIGKRGDGEGRYYCTRSRHHG